MSVGLAIALLLTLQNLQLVLTQTPKPSNEELSTLPAQGIPESWKRGGLLNSTEGEFSGDYDYEPNNQSVTKQHNADNADSLPQTALSPTKNNESLIQQNSTNNSATNSGSENKTETNTTSPGNSTITTTTTSNPAFNITKGTTLTTSGNVTTTSPHQGTSYTSSNSTTTTSIVVLNGTSTVSTTNATEGSHDNKGNVNGGLSSDYQLETKSKAWGAILGIGFGVALIGLVIYIIVKRRNYRDFSHRKLEEEMPGEPVHRLDNGEPLDLKLDGFAYYNPGLQGDNIQMTNFPQGKTN